MVSLRLLGISGQLYCRLRGDAGGLPGLRSVRPQARTSFVILPDFFDRADDHDGALETYRRILAALRGNLFCVRIATLAAGRAFAVDTIVNRHARRVAAVS